MARLEGIRGPGDATYNFIHVHGWREYRKLETVLISGAYS